MQLLIPLSTRGEPLYRQLYRGLRKAILDGTVPTGQKLPSTREIVEQLEVSRTAALMAYEHRSRFSVSNATQNFGSTVS